MRPAAQGGFSLLEVMIAWLVLTLGLLGMGLALIQATRSASGSYLRTQAMIAADSLANRIYANRSAAFLGEYHLDLSSPPPLPTGACSTAECDSHELAQADLQEWYAQFKAILPGLQAGVSCDPDRGCAAGAMQTITLIWEEPEAGADGASGCGGGVETARQCYRLQFAP